MQRVHCQDQEHWFVKRTRCACGAAFSRKSVGAQRLIQGRTGPVDVLQVTCERCGAQHALEFDISSFFGKPDTRAFEALFQNQDRVWQLFVWSQLEMESVLKYLASLAEAKDAASIEYIIDAARHYLMQAQSNDA